MSIETESGGEFFITAKPLRDTYYIYKKENGKAVRLGQAKSPTVLEEKYTKGGV